MNKETFLERITTAQVTEGSKHVVLSQDEAMALCQQWTDAHTTGVREGLRQAAEMCEALAKTPKEWIGPWEVAGTDYRADNMRCLKEGGAAALRQAARVLRGEHDAPTDAAPTEVTRG